MTTIIPAANGFYTHDGNYAMGELEKVLGQLPERLKRDYVGQQSRTHGDLTELLMSRISPVVSEQVTGLLLKTYVSPITNFLMPIRQLGPYESIQINWMEINFEPGLAPQVEVEGLARLYGHEKTRRGARAVRRGVAVKVEEGFFLTPEGRKEWVQQIEQLATIIQRTNEYDAIMTLLQTPLRDHVPASELGGAYNHIYGARRGMSRYERLLLQRDWFSIVNKAEDSRGFSNCVSQLRTTMKKKGVEPNAIVVPPNLMSTFYGTSDDLWNYNSAGPAVAQNRAMAEDIGPDNGIRTQTFQGLRVVDTYVQRSTVGGHEEAGDLLTVPVQIGEFYPMSTNDFLVDDADIHSFQGKKRNIRIFNEEQSRIVPVSFEHAIVNCLRWSDNGQLNVEDHNQTQGDDIFLYTDATGQSRMCQKWCDMEEKWFDLNTAKRVAHSILCKFDNATKADLRESIIKFKMSYIYNGAIPPDAPASLPNVNGGGLVNKATGGADYEAALTLFANGFLERFKVIIDRVATNLGAVGVNSGVTSDDVKDFIGSGFNFDKIFANVINNDQRNWNETLVLLDEPAKLALAVFLLTDIHRDNCVSLHRADIYLPFDFLLARPYMTYLTSSVIMMLAGKETGEIVVGQQRFQMTSNIGDRTLYANYFYYGKAIVYKEANVIVAPNVFIQDYVKGTNIQFINDSDLSEIHDNSGLMNSTNSILAIMIKAGEDITSTNVVDIRGKNSGLDIPGHGNQPHYSTYNYYNTVLQLDPRSLADPLADYQDYEDLHVHGNSICFLGHTENWAGNVLYANTGHLGPHTYNQCNLSRKPGHYAAIRSMTSLAITK